MSDKGNFLVFLPQDVSTQILLKLTSTSLVTCNCVCKTWNSFIKSPQFFSSHLDRSIKNDAHHLCLFQLCSLPANTGKDSFFLRSNDLNFSLRERLHFPFKSKYGGFQVLASCNGLVCLMNGKYDAYCCPYGLILWNPVIRKSMIVENDPPLNPVEAVGLGFDSRTGDYKLLIISEQLGQETSMMVNLYSLKANSWKRLPDVAAMLVKTFNLNRAMTLLNGALHFISLRGWDENPRLMIWGFDLRDEVFHEIMLPRCMVDEFSRHGCNINRRFHLFACGNSLAVSWLRDSIKVMEIWVMKEYAVEGSWTQLATIRLEGPSVPTGLEITGFVFREDAHVLLSLCSYYEEAGRIFSYDLKSQVTTEIKTVGKHACFLLDNYVESLVLMDKGDDLSKNFETDSVDAGAMTGNTSSGNADLVMDTSSYATGSRNAPPYLLEFDGHVFELGVASSDKSSDSE